MCVKDYSDDMAFWKVENVGWSMNLTCVYQIDEIWIEFCCEQKLTEKKEFVDRETRKYEYVEEEEIVEDFGQVRIHLYC